MDNAPKSLTLGSNVDDLMGASCALPTAFREQPRIGNHHYVDGGVADAIPVKQAYDMGAREITVILSQPPGFTKPAVKSAWLLEKMYRDQPELLKSLLNDLKFIMIHRNLSLIRLKTAWCM